MAMLHQGRARSLSNSVMMLYHLLNYELEKLFSKNWIEIGGFRKTSQSCNLLNLSSWICCRQSRRRLELANEARAFEAFRQHVNQCCIDVINAGTETFELFVRIAVDYVSRSVLRCSLDSCFQASERSVSLAPS